MTDEALVTPGYVKPPTDELSNTLWGALTEAEASGEAQVSARDLCVLAVYAAHSGAQGLPPEYGPLLTAAYAELGLPAEPSASEVERALQKELKARPLDAGLVAALEGFRTGGLGEATQRSRASLLGNDASTKRARGVEDRPKLTGEQLLRQRPVGGKTIIR